MRLIKYILNQGHGLLTSLVSLEGRINTMNEAFDSIEWSHVELKQHQLVETLAAILRIIEGIAGKAPYILGLNDQQAVKTKAILNLPIILDLISAIFTFCGERTGIQRPVREAVWTQIMMQSIPMLISPCISLISHLAFQIGTLSEKIESTDFGEQFIHICSDSSLNIQTMGKVYLWAKQQWTIRNSCANELQVREITDEIEYENRVLVAFKCFIDRIGSDRKQMKNIQENSDQVQICEICFTHKATETICTNSHLLCAYCLHRLQSISLKPECPFCNQTITINC
ncbi:MAG: hypothetical protein EZS28_004562 [Streblomastix strix]|uniref:RING-type domain-containing protein n=1 Tax=Streblomastix strix TaxID=222440 RepID=A0A5J4WYE4_9EUKA|nr:MAG: hypothetical protein EZS28_004562 [Streblomastix strix]